ncbi:lipopolysaccharide heptosyltransferase I [Parachlamydia sp. AcF125]|uniref:lipopolysaccharide heptosyltransferase I n=1 Tax=Parachlamydia sp. AcF125 TaxID=2795736 RepID=UPI001BC8E771|nr:lipopolysaccharide heptosyltransferase I [Parachlamydia sp. AcF125]MBS4168558.1 Lipopolysaccharide heptosyltransferase 1 [Parachlamydia sp. AcF125]
MKILLVKTSSLGDIIQAFPVLDYLKNRFPEAQIDWVVEKPFSELVEGHPAVSNVLHVHTKKWRKFFPLRENFREICKTFSVLRQVTYDVLFDLQGNSKSAFITAMAKAAKKVGFGWNSAPEWPNLLVTNAKFDPPAGYNIREDYLAIPQQFFNDHTYLPQKVLLKIAEEEKASIKSILLTSKKTVMVCPGAIWRNKQLPEKTLAELLQMIQQKFGCHYLLIWGSPEEKEVANRLHAQFRQNSQIVNKLPLPLLQNLMSQVGLVLAMDSLPLHLAGTTGTPTFSIFGASLASKYQPLGEQNASFQGACPYGQVFTKRCPALRRCKTGACIRELSATDLFLSFDTHCSRYFN